MKAFRSGMALVAGAGLLAGLSACANPASSGSDVTANEVGPVVENTLNEEIAAMVPEDLRSVGEFTVAVNPDIAPVKFLDSNGEVAGLNPELLEAAGVVMGLDVTFRQATFDALVPGLEAERFDVIASIGDFKERQGTVDFIDYLMTGSALIVSADYEGDSLAEADMCGMKLSFVRGTYQQGQIESINEDCTTGGNKAIEATGYGDANGALLSVKSGQADGFWGDLQQLTYNEKTNPELYKVVANDVAGPYGIGINKKDAEFRDALQAALVHLVDNGTYDQTLEKWGQQEFGMPKMPLNTGGSIEG
jgi:polar amino acid transport system substrate-binding protein